MISVDEQVIEEAYREQLKKTFAAFYSGVLEEGDDPEGHFIEKLQVLRKTKQQAISAVRQQ